MGPIHGIPLMRWVWVKVFGLGEVSCVVLWCATGERVADCPQEVPPRPRPGVRLAVFALQPPGAATLPIGDDRAGRWSYMAIRVWDLAPDEGLLVLLVGAFVLALGPFVLLRTLGAIVEELLNLTSLVLEGMAALLGALVWLIGEMLLLAVWALGRLAVAGFCPAGKGEGKVLRRHLRPLVWPAGPIRDAAGFWGEAQPVSAIAADSPGEEKPVADCQVTTGIGAAMSPAPVAGSERASSALGAPATCQPARWGHEEPASPPPAGHTAEGSALSTPAAESSMVGWEAVESAVPLACGVCGRPLIRPARGPAPRYCSSTCRVRAHRDRQRHVRS